MNGVYSKEEYRQKWAQAEYDSMGWEKEDPDSNNHPTRDDFFKDLKQACRKVEQSDSEKT